MQGHPQTIHPFFARRPLAAARAVLFASLVDDPGNSLPEKEAKKERQRLHKLIGELVKWENTDNTSIFKKALTEIKKSYPDKLPKIYDPFCGGGIIPLEAHRLGLPVFASDLNPVAVLITKCLVEISQKFLGLEPVNPQVLQKEKSKGMESVATDVDYYGKLVLKEAEKKLKVYYPKINNSNVIAWIWARIVVCPNPACKAEIPLTGSFKISEKKGKAFWVSLEYDKKKRVSFKIKFDNNKITEKTVKERKAFCPLCKESVRLKPYVMDEGRKGRIGKKMMAIVLENGSSLTVISPTKEHEVLAASVKESYKPNVELPKYTETFKPVNYGFSTYGDLFSNRQLLAINTFIESIQNTHEIIERDAIKAGMIDDKKPLQNEGKGARAYADTIVTYLALQLGRSLNYWSTFNPWKNSYIVNVFRRQALYMIWDFAEVNPFSNRSGSWNNSLDFMTRILKKSIVPKKNAEVSQLDATSVFYPKDKPIVCTDPPYYNNISYSDLTDYFYVWLRRMLQKIFPDICSTLLCPKEQELIALPYRFDNDKLKADNFYEDGFKKVFTFFKNEANQEAPFTFFYAYKDETGTRGWETMLQSLVSSGLQITGTWPMSTESEGSLDSQRNVLSSSIVIVCRKRLKNTNLCTRREFISELRKEFQKTIAALRDGNISPVDLSQVTIGPGMSIFSQFSQVLEANGNPMQIHTALEIINHELDSFFIESDSDLIKIQDFVFLGLTVLVLTKLTLVRQMYLQDLKIQLLKRLID